ncbi:MAG: hypothetical protein DLM58_02925 [Pseudonocardiales bacterium]|nr:MAG: hypothetical protein DLM58_02925 [Pseudonocardiales bacterium]
MNFQAVTDADTAEVGRLLAISFHQDPGPVWWFPDDASRTDAAEPLFTANARLAVALGDGLLSETRDAAALYLPPGTEITDEAVAAAALPEVLAGYGAETTGQLGRFLATLGGMHVAAMPGPHWQLFFLGVDPAVQGTGLGVALVDEVNMRALRDGVPVYLDTLTARNVGFYERRGYQVVAECDVPDSPVHVWGLRFN